MLWGNRNGFFYVLDAGQVNFSMANRSVKSELGKRARCQMAAIATPQPAGGCYLSGNTRRNELVSPSLQPEHRTVLSLPHGKITPTIFSRIEDRIQGRHALHGRREHQPRCPGLRTPRVSARGQSICNTEAIAAAGCCSHRSRDGRRPEVGNSKCMTSNTSGI